MKKLAISSITAYQIFLSAILKSIIGTNRFCRFEETCSAYTKRVIRQEGFAKGLILGLGRLAKCQPFYPAPLLSKAVDNLQRKSKTASPHKRGLIKIIVEKGAEFIH